MRSKRQIATSSLYQLTKYAKWDGVEPERKPVPQSESRKKELEIINCAWSQLDLQQRIIIRYYYIDDMTTKAISLKLLHSKGHERVVFMCLRTAERKMMHIVEGDVVFSENIAYNPSKI